MGGSIVFASITWFCSAIFIGIGIYAIKRKTPMHFWAGSTVDEKELTDVKAYNKLNGIMWIIYGATYTLAGLFSLLNIIIGVIILVIAGILGTLLLIPVYNRIYRRYKA